MFENVKVNKNKKNPQTTYKPYFYLPYRKKILHFLLSNALSIFENFPL